MNLGSEGAEAFATDWIEHYYDKDFEKFVEEYRHASSLLGMNLSHRDVSCQVSNVTLVE
jgi:hypothetical protein